MSKKVSFHTLGCKLNFSETSAIGKQFVERGFSIVNFNDKSDVYVINTCTVTDGADKECRQIVRRALRNNPNAFIIVTGCYTQLRSDEVKKIKGVDLILGSNDKFNLFSKIIDFEKNENPAVYVTPLDKMSEFYSAFSTEADSRTRAFLKIQDGCDYTCTYCTIPLARGKSRSDAKKNVLRNFKKLIENGYKEIILTGVNVGTYGQDINESLYSLLAEMIKIEGDFRIRISSIEPNLLTDEIIELTASSAKLCKHFHIPLQSGSDEILSKMQRRYNTKTFKKLIEKINRKIPDVGIGIDVIVGFPGESDNHFNETYNLLNDLKYSYLHVFTYSERPNTKALNIPDAVDFIVRKERNIILRKLSEEKLKTFQQNLIGKELQVLFEHSVKNGMMKGFASNYVRVSLPENTALINELVDVKIIGSEDQICRSVIVDSK